MKRRTFLQSTALLAVPAIALAKHTHEWAYAPMINADAEYRICATCLEQQTRTGLEMINGSPWTVINAD